HIAQPKSEDGKGLEPLLAKILRVANKEDGRSGSRELSGDRAVTKAKLENTPRGFGFVDQQDAKTSHGRSDGSKSGDSNEKQESGDR
ncbi:MAG: hypothetical protein ABR542_10900, partial [Desulfonatronovibrio sp.]